MASGSSSHLKQITSRDSPDLPESIFRIGPILFVSKLIVVIFWHLSLVEYFKYFFMAFARSEESQYSARVFAIDVYMVTKWMFVVSIISFEVYSFWATAIVCYLIASVYFSYFYYHVWKHNPEGRDHNSQLRRTVSFTLSFLFGLVGYAYLYLAVFSSSIDWPRDNPSFGDAMLLSLSTAFTSSFAAFRPLTEDVKWFMASETIFVFGFLVVIIVNSLPTQE